MNVAQFGEFFSCTVRSYAVLVERKKRTFAQCAVGCGPVTGLVMTVVLGSVSQHLSIYPSIYHGTQPVGIYLSEYKARTAWI